jgi:hypothetical protein
MHCTDLCTAPLKYRENTNYKPIPNARCCDVCTPDLFPIDKITLDKIPGLKRGKKKKLDEKLAETVREGLVVWRDGELIDTLYPGTVSIPGAFVLGDDVIEQLVNCGERIENEQELRQHTRWFLGFTKPDGLTIAGEMLIAKLQEIYMDYDAKLDADRARHARIPATIAPESFYSR